MSITEAFLRERIKQQEQEISYLKAVIEGDVVYIIKRTGHAYRVKPGDRVRYKRKKTKFGTVKAICLSDRYVNPQWYPNPFVVVRWDEHAKDFDKNHNNNPSLHQVSLDNIVVVKDRRISSDRRKD